MTPYRDAVFLDTSASAALAVRSEADHRLATERIRRLTYARKRFLTTNYIVAETHALVVARGGRALALRTLDGLERGSTIVVHATPEDELRARSIVRDYQDTSFSLVDAISFAVMDRLRITASFAFDRHFAQYGFTLVS